MPKVYQIYYFTPWGNAYWVLKGVQIPKSLHFPTTPQFLQVSSVPLDYKALLFPQEIEFLKSLIKAEKSLMFCH